MTDAQARRTRPTGFEIALHLNTQTASTGERRARCPVGRCLLALVDGDLPRHPAPRSNRTHCIAWTDWAARPRPSARGGSGSTRTTTTGRGPGSLAGPGLFTGSGFPCASPTPMGRASTCTRRRDNSSTRASYRVRRRAHPTPDRWRTGTRRLLRRLPRTSHRLAEPACARRHHHAGPGPRRPGGVGGADARLARRPQRLVFPGGLSFLSNERLRFNVPTRREVARPAGDAAGRRALWTARRPA